MENEVHREFVVSPGMLAPKVKRVKKDHRENQGKMDPKESKDVLEPSGLVEDQDQQVLQDFKGQKDCLGCQGNEVFLVLQE